MRVQQNILEENSRNKIKAELDSDEQQFQDEMVEQRNNLKALGVENYQKILSQDENGEGLNQED